MEGGRVKKRGVGRREEGEREEGGREGGHKPSPPTQIKGKGKTNGVYVGIQRKSTIVFVVSL